MKAFIVDRYEGPEPRFARVADESRACGRPNGGDKLYNPFAAASDIA
jgi:hypothetical protein